MNKNFGVTLLIICFSASSVNVGWASEVVNVGPVVVQPYDTQALNQQVMGIDRQNRDEEIAIKQLIEQNDQLTRSTLANQQNEGLEKINQTMLSYRDALLARDRARIMNNSGNWGPSRYGDLIALTEDADGMTIHRHLVEESGLLTQKYQMLSDLKDEMTNLNDKLLEQKQSASSKTQATLDGFKTLAQEDQDKIDMLVSKLDAMDQKITHLNDLLEQKEHQIMELKENLTAAHEKIQDQANQIDLLQAQAKVSAPVAVSMPGTVSAPVIVSSPAAATTAAAVKAFPIANVISSSPTEGVVALGPIVVNPPSVSEMPVAEKLQNKISHQPNNQDAIIQQQRNQIAVLKSEIVSNALAANVPSSSSTGVTAVAPIVVNPPNTVQEQEASNNEVIKEKQEQVDLLKSELDHKIAEENKLSDIITQMQHQLDAKPSQNQGVVYSDIQAQMAALKNQIQSQTADLKAKDDTIGWLRQVLAVAKNKASYYKLTSQINQMPVERMRQEIENIKADFANHFKDYDQFETAIVSLKAQVQRLMTQLSQKQGQIDSLTSELADKNTEEKNQLQQQMQELKQAQEQIQKAKTDDRLGLAKQLIGLQEEEASLLQEKDDLEKDQNDLFDRHALAFENRIKELLAQHRIQNAQLSDRMEELRNEFAQSEQQVELLKTELRDKIAQENTQTVLVAQVDDLKSQLQIQNDQIAAMKTRVSQGQQANASVDSLQQQLTAAQDRADQLKQQLDNKTAETVTLTSMMKAYQTKLESKDNAYNTQLGKVLTFKNYRAMMEKQIAFLNSQLQQREAVIVQIKKAMYDLQESAEAKQMDIQAKDLSQAMVQQRATDSQIKQYQDKINDLQKAMKSPVSSDEVEYLKTGLQKATDELKAKDSTLLKIKASADEYAKEFKQQSQDFQSLKDQLQDAQDQLQHKDEDLKYKDMAVKRLKEQLRNSNKDLKAEVVVLRRQLDVAEKKVAVKVYGNKGAALATQLNSANDQVRELRMELDQFKSFSKNDVATAKLNQALDKINEQGRIINALVEKLQACTGHSVDLNHI